MPFKSISRHQPSQREPKLSWPSLTGKSLRVCRYHQNKTPQRSSLPKQQQSSNPRQQKAPRPLDVAGIGINFSPCQWSSVSQPAVHITQSMLPLWPKTLYGPRMDRCSLDSQLEMVPFCCIGQSVCCRMDRCCLACHLDSSCRLLQNGSMLSEHD